MNRYLLRSLVAVLAFLIGLAVTPSRRPFRNHFRDRAFAGSVRRAYHCDRERTTYRAPALSIDTVATDPVKASYLQTQSSPDDFRRQKIEFLLENKSSRNISSAIIRYGTWGTDRSGHGGTVTVRFDGNTTSDTGSQTVAVDCEADESLWLWVSYIEFKDGTRWTNPRHSDDQPWQ